MAKRELKNFLSVAFPPVLPSPRQCSQIQNNKSSEICVVKRILIFSPVKKRMIPIYAKIQGCIMSVEFNSRDPQLFLLKFAFKCNCTPKW